MHALSLALIYVVSGVLLAIIARPLTRYLKARLPVPSFLRAFRYNSDLKQLLNEMPFIFMDISLTVLQDYVDTDYEQIDLGTLDAQRIQHRLPLDEAIRSHRRVLILGEAGMGKTTFERHAILALLERPGKVDFIEPRESCIPIFVPLKAVDNSQPNPITRYITTTFPLFSGDYGRQRFTNLAKTNRLLLCLDGYDEISFASGSRNHVRDELNRILAVPEYRAHERQVLLAGCRIWVSSRKEFFRDNPIHGFLSTSRVLAIQFKGVGNNRIQLIVNIFNKYAKHSAIAARSLDPEYFIGQIDSSVDDELAALSRNPLFLTVMCYIYAKQVIAANGHEVTWHDSVSTLIGACINLLILDLDDNKARDLPPVRRAALLRRRNAYVEEKRLFLQYFAAQLITREVPLFTLETLKSEVAYFFSEECKTSNSSAILAELRRDVEGNPHFALQLIYCGVFVVSAIKPKEVLYDFPHRRFREVLAAAYINTPAKYLDILARRQSAGLAEFIKVFRTSGQYGDLGFHLSAFAMILERCRKDPVSPFYIKVSDGFLDEKPLGLEVSLPFSEFLSKALTEEGARFRLSSRLLHLCSNTPELRDRAELTCAEAVRAGQGSRALLGWKVLHQLDLNSDMVSGSNAILSGPALSASVAAAWVSLALEIGTVIPDILLTRLITDAEFRDLAFFPLALKWEDVVNRQPNLIATLRELNPEDKSRFLIRRQLTTGSDIDQCAVNVNSKLNSVIVQALMALSETSQEIPSWARQMKATYFIARNAFSSVIDMLQAGETKGDWFSRTGADQPTYARANTKDFLAIGPSVRKAIDEARGRFLDLDDCNHLCYGGIYNALVAFVKTLRFKPLKEHDLQPSVFTHVDDWLKPLKSEIESYRWGADDLALLRSMTTQEKRRVNDWCEFFEPTDHWRRPSGRTQEGEPLSFLVPKGSDGADVTTSSSQKLSGEIFVSYAWTVESNLILDQLERTFRRRNINLCYDKKEIGYKESIRGFMKRLGQGMCIVVILGRDYLRSKNCMFELLEIAQRGEIYERVFPIVLKDANIYDAAGVVEYIRYWEERQGNLDRRLKEVGGQHTTSLHEELDLFASIRSMFDRIIGILKDMNALSVEQHQTSNFAELAEQVEKRLAK